MLIFNSKQYHCKDHREL